MLEKLKKIGCKIGAGIAGFCGKTAEIVADTAEFFGAKGFAEASRSFSHSCAKRQEEWNNKAVEYQSIVNYNYPKPYQPERPDLILAGKCEHYLNSNRETVVPQVLSQKPKQRLETFRSVTHEVASLFEIEGVTVNLYTPTEQNKRTYGFYNRENNSINLNVLYIYSEDPLVIREQICTIFHEMMHARQWKAANKLKDFGYSKQIVADWNYNFQHYIPSKFGPYYMRQPIERDAFGFEDLIREKIKL